MVQYLVQPNKDSNCLRLVSKVNERKDLGLSTIKATEAAVNFYKEQAKANWIFNANEKENDKFCEAVRTFTRYSDKYTLPVYWNECLVSVWEDQCKENPFLENDCGHSYDCRKINNCSCTPDWEVKLNEKRQEERYQQEHYHRHQPKKEKKKEVTRY